jgi:hypothetical protein
VGDQAEQLAVEEKEVADGEAQRRSALSRMASKTGSTVVGELAMTGGWRPLPAPAPAPR